MRQYEYGNLPQYAQLGYFGAARVPYSKAEARGKAPANEYEAGNNTPASTTIERQIYDNSPKNPPYFPKLETPYHQTRRHFRVLAQ